MRATPVPVPTGPFPGRPAYGLLALLLGAGIAVAVLGGVAGGRHALAFALAPDLALLAGAAPGLSRGQFHPRAVPLSNALHRFAGPLLLGLAALLGLGPPWLLGAFAWAAHVAADRALGFAARTRDGSRRAPGD